MGSVWPWVAVGVLIVAAIWGLLRKRPIDRGEVSGRWIAEHRAGDSGNSLY